MRCYRRLSTIVAGGRGNAIFSAGIRKVDLILEFNSFSGSNFLSRLVLQMFSVPFVV